MTRRGELGSNQVHDTAIIGDEVMLGTGNIIGPYTVILGHVELGDDNWIGPHVAIGTPPETRGGAHPAAWNGDSTAGSIRIGDRNVIREFTTVQQGWADITIVGSDCYLMTKCHVPHDGQLGDRVTVSCSVMIGGHTVVGSGANLGLGTVVHQKLVIGEGAMVGMGSVVTRNIPPYALAYGNPAVVRGANRLGLERAEFEASSVQAIDSAYRQSGDVTGLLSDASHHFQAAVSRLAAT